MDLSALIFVALAVAWATYLIPKALRHHEDSNTARTVDGFSDRMRVLARREPVDSKSARLIVTPGMPASAAVPVAAPAPVTTSVAPVPPAVPTAVRRAAAARAARRRLRVVLVLLLAVVGVGVAAALGAVGVTWLAVPVVILVAWLVACRLMVRRERADPDASAEPGSGRRLPLVSEEPAPVVDEGDPATEEISAVEPARVPEPTPTPTPEPAPVSSGWDPVPVTLPTYVDKEPAARRSVRTIDLDATGVWTSGPLASDSVLARGADAERRARTAEAEQRRRASGS